MGGQPKTSGNLALNEKKVIVIEAAPKPEAEKLRVAAYCRVSSDSADQLNSFAAQLNYYTALIGSKENWTLVDLYADEGISGTSAKKRPDFQRLLSDCRLGRVDKVLVKSISRFARNTKDCLETVRELKSIGVGVCFEEQGIDTSNMSGELLTAVFAAVAQKESQNISDNMRWSYQARMRNGTFLPAAVPFGYVIQSGKIAVDEERAAIVRQIFHSYLAGQSMDEIAAQLNREDIPVRLGVKDRKWLRSAVSYILSNERYIGDSLWQKTYATDTLPARQVKNHGEREQYYAENTHPPIIDRETFFAVQDLRRRRKDNRGVCRRQTDPLRQKIFCGVCGALYGRKTWNGKTFWVCRNHDDAKENCPSGRIPEEEVHAAFLRVYHKLRLHGEPILKQMIANLQSVRERRMLWSLDIVELNKRIADLSDQDRVLADMNKCDLVDPDIFISQSNELARQLRAAKQEKERLLAGGDDDAIPKTRELMETLDSLPEFLPDFDGEIFTDLVDRITAEGDGALRFWLKNGLELTEMTERSALMANRKQPFGYCIRNGQIQTAEHEAETVRVIFDCYVAGTSYDRLTGKLNGQEVSYLSGKPWSKNMVARVLQDERYTGGSEYPQIVTPERFQQARMAKPDASGTANRTEIKDIRILARCGLCHGPMRRERKTTGTAPDAWTCRQNSRTST